MKNLVNRTCWIVIEPIGYLRFLNLMMNAKFVLTDSGGMQEETTVLNIPCLTLRENTERPETINEGTNTLVGNDTQRIIEESFKTINGQGKTGTYPELWDGRASERLCSQGSPTPIPLPPLRKGGIGLRQALTRINRQGDVMNSKKLFDYDEFKRWLSQAENTLNSATHDLSSGDYNWCCFKSQQAAEYSVKSLLRGLGQMAIGHSVLKLLEELEESGSEISEELKSRSRSLDKHYIPPRYPNAYPAGAPFEFYDEEIAREAVGYASKIFQFVKAEKERYVTPPNPPKGGYKALKRREKEREKAIQLATEYARSLEKNIGSLTGVLYGSFARGDFNLSSDIDVLIISNSLPEGFFERMDLLYRYVQGMIEPKGYTQTEFLNMFHSNNPLAMDALNNGEILSDDGFWSSLRKGNG